VRLTADTAAIPEPSVIPLPALFPFSVKATDFPLSPVPLELRVADKSATPPNSPEAVATTRVVPGVSLKQTVTSWSVGVVVPLLVLNDAWYFR
jgi:hypothetical protein